MNKAIQRGHFRLSSGRHAQTYVQCASLLSDPAQAFILGDMLARHWADEKIDAVISPAVGGIIIGYEIARSLGVKFLFAEKPHGTMELRRNQQIPTNSRVLVVEDVITTGGSARAVGDMVEGYGSEVVGYACIAHRLFDGASKLDGKIIRQHYTVDARSWDEEECPLCEKNVPIEAPGSGNLC